VSAQCDITLAGRPANSRLCVFNSTSGLIDCGYHGDRRNISRNESDVVSTDSNETGGKPNKHLIRSALRLRHDDVTSDMGRIQLDAVCWLIITALTLTT
jgi:hypothetical protein